MSLLALAAQLATLDGIVTKPGGSEPLPGATVVLNPVASSQSSSVRTAVSQDDGRFALGDIQSGEYRLEAHSPLYGGAQYGQRKPDGPGAILSIAPGERLSDLRLSMSPTGAIAGRIAGRSGEPLAHATVQALKYRYQSGRRVPAVAQSATTDDRGEYRLFWLSGGEYLVVAAPRSSPIGPGTSPPIRPGKTILTSDLPFLPLMLLTLGTNQAPVALLDGTSLVHRILADGTIEQESWMPTYYPAMTDRAQAVPVKVTAGSTVTGIDITLGPSPVQKIRGLVTGVTPGTAATVAMAAAGSGRSGQLIRTGVSPIDGSFEFAGVLPGLYYLTAQDGAGLTSSLTAASVGGRDIEGLSISLAPAVTVLARVAVEGPVTAPLDAFGVVGVLRPLLAEMEPSLQPNLGPRSARLDPGNRMAFSNVPPGEYQFDISQAAIREDLKQLHIKSVRLGREDALDTVRISSGMAETLEIVLTAETSFVQGVAVGQTGEPEANVTVTLIPSDSPKRTDRYQSLVTGSDGRFRFAEVPPGDYELFAWDDVETGAWESSDFIRQYRTKGLAMRVSGDDKAELQLNVIYIP